MSDHDRKSASIRESRANIDDDNDVISVYGRPKVVPSCVVLRTLVK